jgi:hypothetical protein
MSDFDDVLERLLTDQSFAAALTTDPDAALAGYRLDAGEIALLRSQVSGDAGGASAVVEARTTKSSTFGLFSALGDFSAFGSAAGAAAHHVGEAVAPTGGTLGVASAHGALSATPAIAAHVGLGDAPSGGAGGALGGAHSGLGDGAGGAHSGLGDGAGGAHSGLGDGAGGALGGTHSRLGDALGGGAGGGLGGTHSELGDAPSGGAGGLGGALGGAHSGLGDAPAGGAGAALGDAPVQDVNELPARSGFGNAPRHGLGDAGPTTHAEPPQRSVGDYHNRVDADGDGHWDKATYSARADGGVDIKVDVNHDGKVDFVGRDYDRDWKVDEATIDRDKDGVFEKTMYDDDNDGWLDRTVWHKD